MSHAQQDFITQKTHSRTYKFRKQISAL